MLLGVVQLGVGVAHEALDVHQSGGKVAAGAVANAFGIVVSARTLNGKYFIFRLGLVVLMLIASIILNRQSIKNDHAMRHRVNLALGGVRLLFYHLSSIGCKDSMLRTMGYISNVCSTGMSVAL